MCYLIFVETDDGREEMFEGPVGDLDRQCREQVVVPTLIPLDEDDYGRSLAVLLHTFARSSYIHRGKDVYWCTEWNPCVIVVRFAPTGNMSWTAMRSPIPDFGGRVALASDIDAYDEDA